MEADWLTTCEDSLVARWRSASPKRLAFPCSDLLIARLYNGKMEIMNRYSVCVILVATAFAGCTDNGDGGGSRGNESVKSAGEIESEVSKEMQAKPYSELIVGQATINCPEEISQNLKADKTTICTAKDEAGNVGEFRIRSHGDSYEFSPGELTTGLALGSSAG